MKKAISIIFTFLLFFLSISIVKADDGFCFCSEDDDTYTSIDESCTSDSDCATTCDNNGYAYAVCVQDSEDAMRRARITDGHCVCDGSVPLENVACNDDNSCNYNCFQFGYTTGTCRLETTRQENDRRSQERPSTITIDPTTSRCTKTLGKNFSRLVKASITIFQVLCVIFALVKGMILLIPPIISKDMKELEKSGKKLVLFAGILIAALLFRSIIIFIGRIANLDVTCITFIVRSLR